MKKLYVGGAMSREASQGLRLAGHGEGLGGEWRKERSRWDYIGHLDTCIDSWGGDTGMKILWLV